MIDAGLKMLEELERFEQKMSAADWSLDECSHGGMILRRPPLCSRCQEPVKDRRRTHYDYDRGEYICPKFNLPWRQAQLDDDLTRRGLAAEGGDDADV